MLRKRFERGAIAPSSTLLADQAVIAAKVDRARTIAELGAGNGVITRRIEAYRRRDSAFVVVERDRQLCELLTKRFPRPQILCDCASRLGTHSAHLGISGFDAIVSALPWSNFDTDLRTRTLSGVANCLAPNGTFTTIVCFGLHWLPPGRHLHSVLRRTFASVHTTPVILANMPPAFLYICWNEQCIEPSSGSKCSGLRDSFQWQPESHAGAKSADLTLGGDENPADDAETGRP